MVATFAYETPGTVQEAIAALGRHGDDAKILAGGQSLIPLLNLGLAQPSVLIDITTIGDLEFIEERDGTVAIGAMTRYVMVQRSELARRACPLLAEALPFIGDRQIRNRGTIGGSLAHADPVAEVPTVAACLGATMRITGQAGARDVPASEFFVTYLTTAIGPGELLTEVRFPVAAPRTGVSFQELVRRQGDFAIVAAAATVTLGEAGECRDVQLALAGVDATPIRVDRATDVLRNQQPTAERIRDAARAACDGIDPESDIMASAEYRRAMAEVFARRALEQAAHRASVGA